MSMLTNDEINRLRSARNRWSTEHYSRSRYRRLTLPEVVEEILNDREAKAYARGIQVGAEQPLEDAEGEVGRAHERANVWRERYTELVNQRSIRDGE